ncbi:Low-density lipoprotein receptor class A domain-containing protein 2 [Pteropus alecto]|uniref:Low-density lipoprotein receptor class A domain-containing protein 2 n=1 Tax=Pteropus alecto TaxID=9402 RepID=L5JUK7_PTEAL|nr:Low-density lipoprotein receptor class A domain-containing protein 2 [Pteropus alecto]
MWQGDGLLLRSHSASRRFYFVDPDTDCELWVRAAAPSDRIRFQFRFFLVYTLTSESPASSAPNASSPASTDACAPGSYLQFYEGPPGAPRPLGAPLCGLTIPVPVMSFGEFLGLRLVTRGRQPRVDFVGEVTSFRLGSCDGYFRCRNSRCIPPSLVCDLWGMDNCGDGSDQASWPPANCRGPSLVPSQVGSTEDDTSKPLTVSSALESAGPLQIVSESSSPAGQGPIGQDAALEGPPWLQRVALAALLLLASAGLLIGLLWCCCFSSWLARWASAHDLCLSCTICHMCPGQVAPGGLRPSGPAFQGQVGHP